MQNLTFFENIKLYVGFTDASSAALRELHPIALPFFQPIVDHFYAVIESHPGPRQAITGGQVAASIGHELRNPLGVVESALYLLRQHLKAEAEAPSVKKHLDRIGSEVVRANKTIHDLLDLARNRPPQRRPTLLHQLVESAAEAALLPAAVALHVSVPADLILIIDPDQVRQVLANLFTN